jgi:transcriptional regulator with GAF, ATPase, and Fis domain
MDLKRVESQRSELLLFVIALVMIFLGAIAYISFRQGEGLLVPALTIVSLLACLYIIDKERRLRKLQRRLIQELLDEQDRSASLETRLKEITALYRAIAAVNSVVEPEDTFDTVLRAALELVGADRGSVMLLDDLDERLKIVSAQGLPQAVVAQTRQKLGQGIAGWVAQQREPLLLDGPARDDERFEYVFEVAEDELSSSISVPLHIRDETLGVLNMSLTERATRDALTEYELRIATVFAQHAAAAIENARLRLAAALAAVPTVPEVQ